MKDHFKTLLKFAAVIEEAFSKDPNFLEADNYYDYLEACKVLVTMGYHRMKADSKIVEFMAETEMFL